MCTCNILWAHFPSLFLNLTLKLLNSGLILKTISQTVIRRRTVCLRVFLPTFPENNPFINSFLGPRTKVIVERKLSLMEEWSLMVLNGVFYSGDTGIKIGLWFCLQLVYGSVCRVSLQYMLLLLYLEPLHIVNEYLNFRRGWPSSKKLDVHPPHYLTHT